MNIRELLAKGQAEQDRQHDEQEIAKRGNLRGGSAGVVGTDGQIYGECHRVALARLLGAEKDTPENRKIMFAQGNANEDTWAGLLRDAGCEIVREEEYPVTWPIPGTDRVATGRPDILIGETEFYRAGNGIVQAKFVPKLGLELKGVFSHSTAFGVEIEGRPQNKHLCQAAFYSMALGKLPYVLCYTSGSVVDLMYWAQKICGLKKLQPFYRFFYLEWRDETLWYRDEKSDEAIETKITTQGLVDYYKLVVEMEQTKQLGPRPTADFLNGEKSKWDACGICEFKNACDNSEDSFDDWLAEIKQQ